MARFHLLIFCIALGCPPTLPATLTVNIWWLSALPLPVSGNKCAQTCTRPWVCACLAHRRLRCFMASRVLVYHKSYIYIFFSTSALAVSPVVHPALTVRYQNGSTAPAGFQLQDVKTQFILTCVCHFLLSRVFPRE